MKHIPKGIIAVSLMTLICFILAIVKQDARWSGAGGIGTILTFAAWAKWYTRNDKDNDTDDIEQ